MATIILSWLSIARCATHIWHTGSTTRIDMFSLKKLASEADLKFIVTSDYIVEVFSVGVEHAATANNRQVVAAGFVPFKKILDHLAERPDFSEIFLGGIRWRSVSLSIATPVAMQKPLLDFFVQVRDEIYPS